MHVKKPTLFKSLRTISGYTCSTFREAANMLGLLQSDNITNIALQEAIVYEMPCSLQHLFCIDISTQKLQQKEKLCNLLITIDIAWGRVYCLLRSGNEQKECDLIAKDIQAEQSISITPDDISSIESLNIYQKTAYDEILYAVNNNLQQAFFIDGPGGTAKTYLL